MKIAHIVLSGPFTVGMTYQENLLPIQNARDGHEVTIIASRLSWKEDKITILPEGEEIIDPGIRLVRIKYDFVINYFLTEKIRKASKLLPIIKKFCPDIIFLHDPQSFEILNLAKYRLRNPSTRFIVDVHSNYLNCARNMFSYLILHKLFYKTILSISKSSVDRMYCVDKSSETFLREVYGYTEKNIEIFPLGGLSIRIAEKERDRIREAWHIQPDDIIFIHSGKINKGKRTKELLEFFEMNKAANFRLMIVGSIEDEYQSELKHLLESDNRVLFLGWKTGEELLRLLAVTDVYVQLGSASATLQNAICAGNAIIVSNKEIYGDIIEGNGWIIEDVGDFPRILSSIEKNPKIIIEMKNNSKKICEERLNYETLSSRMCKP